MNRDKHDLMLFVRRMTLVIGVAILALVGCQSGGGESSGSLAGELLGGREVVAAGLTFEVPIAWQPSQPSSRMRAAQLKIPGPGGDAELAVFHFGEGRGGRIEDNLIRWLGQIAMHPGTEAKRDFFEQGGFAITVLSAAGTLKPGRMGMGPKEAQPNSGLVGAVVEGPGGPWFFKATGPEKTIDSQRQALMAMLKSASR